MRLRIRWRLLGLAASSFVATSVPAVAAEDLADILYKKGTISQEEYESLKAESKDDVEVSLKSGLQLRTRDGKFQVHVGGRIMFDAAWYDDDIADNPDGTELRRARLEVEGTLAKVWGFKNEIDFAGDKVSVKDAWLSYGGLKPITIKAGNFKEPFSLEEQTSARYITFMERALPNVFAPSRHLGGMVSAHGANWTVAGGLFGEGVGDAGTKGEDEGYGASGRVTFAPLYDKTLAVHLGVAGAYRVPRQGAKKIRFSERPESHITDVRFVDTGDIKGVDNFTLVGGELAAVAGPFSVQGEYVRSFVDRDAGPDVDFDGWYAYASWFVTGESRKYEPGNGRFGRVKPKHELGDGGWGALELAVRYSMLDLGDRDVQGGRERNVTVGLNWHPHSHIRLMVNYVPVVDVSGGPHAGDEPDVYQIRAQVDF